jgi:hypothetical protein
MSGFALAFHPGGTPASGDPLFQRCVRETGRLKGLPGDPDVVTAPGLAVAKFDAPCSLHVGAATHRDSGSWLVAFGTVLDPDHPGTGGDLTPLLSDLLERGDEVLARLDGVFGLVWHDGRRGRSVVATDPLGFGTVYVRRIGDREYAGSSALALAGLAPCRPDAHALHCFLSTGNVYGEHTLFAEVRRLPPATVRELGSADRTPRTYWAPTRDERIAALGFRDAVDLGVQTLDRITERAVPAGCPVWIDLTGGFDSRIIAMFMDRNERRFLANCVGTPDAVDVVIARKIAQQQGWRLEVIDHPPDWAERRLDALPQALGAGDGMLEILHLSDVLQVHREKLDRGGADVTGLVMGSGGELWRGFFWRQELADLGRTSRVNYARLLDFRVLKPLDRSLLRATEGLDRLRDELTEMFGAVAERRPEDLNVAKLDAIYTFKNTAHTGAYISLALGLLRGIAPLFLKEAVVCSSSIDHRWRNHDRLFRGMFDRHHPGLAAIRTSWGGPASSIRATRIHRFLPYYMFWVRRLVQRLGRKLVGHPLWPEPRVESFPRRRWRLAVLERAADGGWLEPGRMQTGALYEAAELEAFCRRAGGEAFAADDLLGKILTLELACREAGVSL